MQREPRPRERFECERAVGQSERESASWVVMTDVEGNELCVLRAFTPEELATIAGG